MKLQLLVCDKCHAFVPHRKIAEVYVITLNTETKLTIYVCVDCGKPQTTFSEVGRKDENF